MPTLTTTRCPGEATPAKGVLSGLVTAPSSGDGGGRGRRADGAHRPCPAVRAVRRVSRRPGQPRYPLRINWSSRAGGRLAPGVRGGGVGRPGSGQGDLVRGRRVDVAAAAQQRRERGDRGQGGG